MDSTNDLFLSTLQVFEKGFSLEKLFLHSWSLSNYFYLPLDSTGSNVLSYVNMVCASLRNSIPKSVVYCQVREAKRSLLDYFFAELGKREVRIFPSLPSRFLHFRIIQVIFNTFMLCFQAKQMSAMLDEDPAVMQRRTNLAKRLELYRSAQAEIDAVAWAK